MALIRFVYVCLYSLCCMVTFTYRNGVSIVSLFISTGRLAMPDFDEWSKQWAHAFLVTNGKLIVNFLIYELKSDIGQQNDN